MRGESILHRLFVLFVAFSYCSTVPVLSVLHSHDMSAPRSNSQEIASAKIPAKAHPLFCEICVRMQSTHSYVEQLFTHSIIQPRHDLGSADGDKKIFSTLFFLYQDRAPPNIHS